MKLYGLKRCDEFYNEYLCVYHYTDADYDFEWHTDVMPLGTIISLYLSDDIEETKEISILHGGEVFSIELP